LGLKILTALIGFSGVGFIVTYIFHQQIFGLFVNYRFHSSSYLLPWMMLSGAMFAGGQMMSLQKMANMNPGLLIKVKIITALLGCIFNFIGAYFYGMFGVVMAQLGFSFIYSVWMISITYKNEINFLIKKLS